MQAIAKARFLRTSPRKARLVIDAIRGKDVKEALGILKFTPNKAARLIEKVVMSAAANAENNHNMNGDSLKVALAMVDGGPNVMKRVRHAPMGRGYRIVKRMSHITIGVEEYEPKPEKKSKRKPAAKAAKPASVAKSEAVTRTKKEAAKAEEPAAVVEEQVVQTAPETTVTEVGQEQAIIEAPAQLSAEAETPVEESSEVKTEDQAKGGE